ncbi:ABC transporter ATP-binding protein [Singulisphaera acidiphila]|uniref:ATPase component of ABC-type sugar transporter n=1 Tax=Singulisphaera acidiphila (strain ATCC BAA-1392 / DSM 18658 / VKM B-2454 / MOB10) TaxID=886293 RepID=L0DFE0_SINAD|nr:ATP-binding cassette domain-containing protein [Singulisphaera acidiphila]AGA27575.1 ATPase component of ABC-type sugar transporter [Singulisphaera acidiphila DSM 18658]
MAQVALKNLTKTYPGGISAVSAIDLDIGDGELFVLVGPSGSGKSTLLRLIAGLETPTTGGLWIGGSRADELAPADRDVAMVFQTPALYPHLSVSENLAFGLRARRFPKTEIGKRVTAVAARLGLDELLNRRPATLSGGQRQRVALGRAIVREPRAFLLDEPFSSLDAPLRAAMRAELIDLHRKLGTTMIHVTHDQAEAMAMGDRIAVMDQGRVVQVGTPLEVYHHPASRFVARFIGSPPMNILPCAVEWSNESARIQVMDTPSESAWTAELGSYWTKSLRNRKPTRVDLGVRPEQIALANGESAEPGRLNASAEVRRLEPLGHETIATLDLGPHPLSLRISPGTAIRVGDQVPIRIDPNHAAWFDAETGLVLQ